MTRAIASALLMLASCSSPQQVRGGQDSTHAGDCLRVQLLRRALVRDAATVDFEMKSGRVLRNHLAEACPGLGPTRAIGYRAYRDRLCSGDLVAVLPASGPVRGATCALGAFEPLGLRTGG